MLNNTCIACDRIASMPGKCHPPTNRVTITIDMVIMFTYSESMNDANFIALYSV
ncbi:MAG: hypothetical protein BWY06_02054 [Candidatus Latescibacteria bacterium ADurb.Bin168]|nr:MAG: hypothetical protein BWY06_02054 [Candidatus Latescibacteria bacterium ADurb.Bin168]